MGWDDASFLFSSLSDVPHSDRDLAAGRERKDFLISFPRKSRLLLVVVLLHYKLRKYQGVSYLYM